MFQILKNTFLHIPGIGKQTENQIWKNNIYNWHEFLENHYKISLSGSRKQYLYYHVQKSIQAYNNQNHEFFLENLPGKEHWRCYKDLNPCFLDIETTGLDRYHDDITLIGIYDGKQSKIFIKGKNLGEFQKEIQKYPLIISFNGKCFDIPFINAKFPNLNLNKFHIDLRFAMRELGYSGGLKIIEKTTGISRNNEIKDIDGFEAVRLWYKYLRGDREALHLLIEYNKADIENLKTLMDFAFNKLKEKHFLSVIG